MIILYILLGLWAVKLGLFILSYSDTAKTLAYKAITLLLWDIEMEETWTL